jgi:peptidyl-prolyl cis-trans isomerase C
MLERAFNNLICCSQFPHFLVLAITLSLAMEAKAAEPEVVLIVGDEHFLRYELEEVISSFVPAAVFHGGVTKEKRDQYIPKALDVLIDRALLYQGAVQSGIRINSSEVDTVVDENIQRFGSKDKFETAVRERGLTLERFRHRIIQQNAINQYIQSELVDRSRYSEKELRTYYDDHPKEFNRPEAIALWHITLKVKPNAVEKTWSEKKVLAEEIVNRARNGENFSSLASRYSDDDYRVKGGWIGYMHRGRLLPELEKQAFALKMGEVAGPIRSMQGYHVIKAGKKKPAEKISFEEASVGLRQRLEKSRMEALRSELLNKLREGVEIKSLVVMGD